MYDTLGIWLPAQSIAEVSYLNKIPYLLDNLTQHTKAESSYITGQLNGLRTSVSVNGISLSGSLCKYYLNDNIQTLTRQDTQRAFEHLEDTLNISFNEAKITRIDMAGNFNMKYEPELYYNYLGDCNRFIRLIQPNSLYYNNGLRTKIFYNKIEEAKKKKVELPKIAKDSNILRYELRFKNRLPQQLNTAISPKTLFKESFYIDLIDKWYNEYETITKLNPTDMNINKLTKPRDVINQMAVMYINSIGHNEAMKLIELLKANNCFEHPTYYTRIKKEIKTLCQEYTEDKRNELIEELSKKIKQVKRHYR